MGKIDYIPGDEMVNLTCEQKTGYLSMIDPETIDQVNKMISANDYDGMSRVISEYRDKLEVEGDLSPENKIIVSVLWNDALERIGN